MKEHGETSIYILKAEKKKKMLSHNVATFQLAKWAKNAVKYKLKFSKKW